SFTVGDSVARQWAAHSGAFHLGIGGPGDVRAIAYSPDSRHIAVARSDDAVRLHDAETGRDAAQLESSLKGIRQIAFSADGQRLAVAGEGSVRVWGKGGNHWAELL